MEEILGEKGALRAGKAFTLFISNKDMNDIIKIIESNVLVDGTDEIVKHEIQKRKGGFLTASLVPVVA